MHLELSYAGWSATVTGWGDTEYGGWGSGRLKEAVTRIIPLKECRVLNPWVLLSGNTIRNTEMCGNDYKATSPACHVSITITVS